MGIVGKLNCVYDGRGVDSMQMKSRVRVGVGRVGNGNLKLTPDSKILLQYLVTWESSEWRLVSCNRVNSLMSARSLHLQNPHGTSRKFL